RPSRRCTCSTPNPWSVLDCTIKTHSAVLFHAGYELPYPHLWASGDFSAISKALVPALEYFCLVRHSKRIRPYPNGVHEIHLPPGGGPLQDDEATTVQFDRSNPIYCVLCRCER